MPSERGRRPGRAGHAVVVGGSIGGCLVAEALSAQFDQVTVFEAGEFRADAAPRPQVPQEHHVHLLLLRGKSVIESIFPGVLDQLKQEGAIEADLGLDVKWFQYGRWKNRYPTGVRAHYCSRALIDSVLRRRVLANPKIDVRPATSVTRLHVDSGAGPTGQVSGVDVTSTGGAETIPADLVVDTSGRRSRAPRWLAENGYGDVPETTVETKLGYTSRVYRQRPELADQWKVLLVLPEPPQGRAMGVISPLEDDRWLVTTGGWFGAYPRSDPGEFEAFLRTLPVPDIADVVQDAEPLSEVVGYRMTGSRMRHYEQLATMPDGLIVLGDAVCSLNPLYSQGMTICALEVEHVAASMARWARGERHAAEIQRGVAAIVGDAWAMAVTEDLRFPEAVGPRPLRLRARHRYIRRLVRASAHSRLVLRAQVGVTNLVMDPAELYRPRIVGRVLVDALRPGRAEGALA